LLPFSIHNLWEKRYYYLFLAFLISFFLTTTLYWKEWISSSKKLEAQQSSLLLKGEHALVSSVSDHIGVDDILQLQTFLGEYDVFIQRIGFQMLFSGIAENKEQNINFYGIGIDTKRDIKTLPKLFKLQKGRYLSDKLDSEIMISSKLSKKLRLKVGDEIRLYTINRNSEKGINSLSLKIVGIFKESFQDRNLVVMPLRISDSFLKSNLLDRVVLKFSSENILQEVSNKISEVGFKFEKSNGSNIFDEVWKVTVWLYVVISITILFISYQSWRADIRFSKDIFETLMIYDWSRYRIFKLLTLELFFLSILLSILVPIISYLSFIIVYEPVALFSNGDLRVNFDIEMSNVVSNALFLIAIYFISSIFSILANLPKDRV
jgi:hypothetical protein